MLKGIKKSAPKTQEINDFDVNRVRSTVNAGQLKQAALLEQEEEEERQMEIEHQSRNNQMKDQRQENTDIYQQCYDLFMSGDWRLLAGGLQAIHSQLSQPDPKQSSKFNYNIEFQDNQKQSLKKRNKPIMSSNRVNQYCLFCPDNEQLHLLSASNYVYLALPKQKTFKNYYHLILAPVDHEQTMIGLNQDILTQINNYKKCLIQAFDKIGLHPIFFETYHKNNSHIYIECLAIKYSKAQDLPFFFKQTLEDIEGNWNTHKNIIKIEKQKGGLQKQIPKAIKYFYIDFTLGYGYAHVIENQKFWKRQFCYQVLATALGMETHQVKSTEEYSTEEITSKRDNFNKFWQPFDWTQLI